MWHVLGKNWVLPVSEDILCWTWKGWSCTSFGCGGLPLDRGSGGSSSSGNISDYEDTLGSWSTVQLRSSAMGWGVMPSLWLILRLPGLWEGELDLVWRLFLQSSVSLIFLAFYPCLHHWSALIRTKSAAKSVRGMIWWSPGHSFRIQSSTVLESSCSCSRSIKIQHLRKHNRFPVRTLTFFHSSFVLFLSSDDNYWVHGNPGFRFVYGGVFFSCLSSCFLYLFEYRFELKVAVLCWDMWTH